jgi:hypothetical protein
MEPCVLGGHRPELPLQAGEAGGCGLHRVGKQKATRGPLSGQPSLVSVHWCCSTGTRRVDLFVGVFRVVLIKHGQNVNYLKKSKEISKTKNSNFPPMHHEAQCRVTLSQSHAMVSFV